MTRRRVPTLVVMAAMFAEIARAHIEGVSPSTTEIAILTAAAIGPFMVGLTALWIQRIRFGTGRKIGKAAPASRMDPRVAELLRST